MSNEINAFEYKRLPSEIFSNAYIGYKYCPEQFRTHDLLNGEEVPYIEIIAFNKDGSPEILFRRAIIIY